MNSRNTNEYIPILERMRMATWFMRITVLLETFFFLFVFYSPSLHAAVENNLGQTPIAQEIQGKTDEERLAKTLQAVKQNVSLTKENVDARLQEEGGIIETVLDFFGLSELQNESLNDLLHLNEKVQGLHTKALANFAKTEALLKSKQVPDNILQRHYKVVEKYQADYAVLQDYIQSCIAAESLHDQQDAMDNLNEFLQEQQFESNHQAIDPNNLPWRTPDAKKVRQPISDPQELSQLIHGQEQKSTQVAEVILNSLVALAYAETPTAGDLSETTDIKFTNAIQLLAEFLNNNPVEIYNWVRNNVEFIPTYGSIQGADYTLQTLRGNAFDTASLLIALLRAANIPARYAYGNIEVPADQVMNWVGGVNVPSAAQQLLGQGGIPNSGVASGGTITSIRMEHVWVEAWVDFQPSRGVNNLAGDKWIPLDASFKQYEYPEPELDTTTFNYDGRTLLESLGTAPIWSFTAAQSAEIDTALDNAIEGLPTFTDTAFPDLDIDEFLGEKKFIIEEYRQLRSGLPYKVIAQTDSYSVIPDNLRHKFRYSLQKRNAFTNILYYEISLPEIAGQQLSVGFKPETNDDKTIIESFIPNSDTANVDDLPESLPGYLINLTAQFNLNGESIQTSGSLVMGEEVIHTAAMFDPVFGWQSREAIGAAGEYRAIGLDLQGLDSFSTEQIEFDLVEIEKALETDTELTKYDLVEKLTQLGINYYFALNDRFNKKQGEKFNIVSYRLPSFGFFHTTLASSYLYGVPAEVNFSGVTMDVPFSSGILVSKDNQIDEQIAYSRVRGLQASYLENWVPEEMFNVGGTNTKGVSATRVLDEAQAAGQQIYVITSANISDINNVNASPSVRQDIINSVNAGKEVTIHEAPITVNNWTGTGYIVFDLNTGAGGYLLSGGTNGGFLGIEESTLLSLLSLGIDFIPGVGSVKALIELVTGKDLITGEPINRWMVGIAFFASLVGGAALAKGLGKLLTKKVDPTRFCFVKGTLIRTKKGLRPIEEIEVGDLVMSKDEITGNLAWKPVTKLFTNKDKPILNISLASTDGKIEVLGVTAEHPFKVKGQSWVMAGDLNVGDNISSYEGNDLTVELIVHDATLHTTYNFEVADYNTYFVGKEGAWVHNQCIPTVKKAVNSNLPHAADRAVERGVFASREGAADALRNLTKEISDNGFPSNAFPDITHADRILVPVGNDGLAVYQVAKNGTAKLKTTLIRRF